MPAGAKKRRLPPRFRKCRKTSAFPVLVSKASMLAGIFSVNQFNNTRFIVLNLVILARFRQFQQLTSLLLSFSGFPPPVQH